MPTPDARPPLPRHRVIRSLTWAVPAALLLACAQGPTTVPKPAEPQPVAVAAAAAASVGAALPASAAAAPIGAVAASAPGRVASAPTAPAQPTPLLPFAVLIRDATKIDGPITAWRKDDKVWLELGPEQLGKAYLFAPRMASGIGEDFLYGGLLRQSGLVEFKRVHNTMQMLLRNTRFTATAGTPEARSVAQAFSPSLLGSTPVLSLPHPDRKSVLVDAAPLFLGDILGLGGQLQRTFRQGYGLDSRNTVFTGVRGQADTLLLEVSAHFATSTLSVPTPGSVPPGQPAPSIPDNLPDPRSMFFGLHYALVRLPDEPMPTRPADPRVGYFNAVVDRYDNDLSRSPRQRYIQRWRLEKKDPAAAMSEPVRPITYWLDRSIPRDYLEPIREGILAWNAAFEAIGIRNAIVVKDATDDNDLALPEIGQGVVRWLSDSDVGFAALALAHVDPRSGEILHAGIGVESLAARAQRSAKSRIFGASASASTGLPDNAALWAELLQLGQPAGLTLPSGWAGGHDAWLCRHGDVEAEQLAYGLDLLAAGDGGEIDPDSPQARQFVRDYLKDTAMHEVGHTLGLRHNFRASRLLSDAELSDPEFTRSHPLSGSVMEYLPINLAAPGQPAPAPFQTLLGEYDLWAIAYGYTTWPKADEPAELARLASRSSEPGLGFATDEDNFLGLDPEALQFDLGHDTLAFAGKRFDIALDLFQRQETRVLKPGEDYAGLRRSLGYAVRDTARAAGIVLRQIGGVRTLRDFPQSGRDPLQPVSGADQRAALDFITRRVLGDDHWVLSPALQRRLAPDFLERGESLGATPTEVSLALTQLDLQRNVLNQLLSDQLANRLLESQSKFDRPEQALQLTELYQSLEAEVWRELAHSGQGAGLVVDIGQRRRDLQRDYANRLATLVLRPGALTRSDARALVRSRASVLLGKVQTSLRAPAPGKTSRLSPAARLHLQDVADTLSSALAAPLQRVGV